MPGKEHAAKPAKQLFIKAPGLSRIPKKSQILGENPLIFHLLSCHFDIQRHLNEAFL